MSIRESDYFFAPQIFGLNLKIELFETYEKKLKKKT